MSNNNMLNVFKEAFLKTLVVVLAMIIVGFATFMVVEMAISGGKNDKEQTSTMDPDELQEQLDNESSTEDEAAPDEGEDGKDEDADNSDEGEADDEGSLDDEDGEDAGVSSKDLKIVVLNSTEKSGLAGTWADKLKNKGYTNVYTGNYKVGMLDSTKIIVVKDGYGKDLVDFFSNAVLETGNLTSGYSLVDSSVSTDDIAIFIIIGTDDMGE